MDDFDYCKYDDPSVTGVHPNKDYNSITLDYGDQHNMYDYNSITLDHGDLHDKQSQHPSRDGDIEEHNPLIRKYQSSESLTSSERIKKRCRRESMDRVVESVFRSVRSLSTEDIQADMNNCDHYLSSSVIQRGKHRIN